MGRVSKLAGEKIFLSPLSADDADDFHRWMCSDDVTDWVGHTASVITLEQEEAMLEGLAGKDNARVFAIVSADGDETLLGNCSINGIDHLHGTAELGILVGNAGDRGRGVGTEAISLLLDFSFMCLNLHNVCLAVLADNARAIRCYEKAGFTEYGRRHECEWSRGRYHDMVLMEVTRDKWEEMRRDGRHVYPYVRKWLLGDEEGMI